MEIDSLGYGTDYISDRQMAKVKKIGKDTTADNATRTDAVFITEGGAEYKGLIDPRKPIDVKQLQKMAQPEELRSQLGLRYIRRNNPYGHHYFIANLTPGDVDDYVRISVPWKDAVWYNPLTDEYNNIEEKDGKIRVSLLSGESRFLLVFDEERHGTMPFLCVNGTAPYFTAITPARSSTHPGRSASRRLRQRYPAPGRCHIHKHGRRLTTTVSGRPMGTGIYTTTIELSKTDAQKRWAIDLGDVRESARVYINGRFIGCAWAAPFILNTNGTLRKGRNEIRIEVTNLPANRIADMDRRGIPWRKMKDINVVDINYKKTTYANWTPMKSGLNSEVKLVEY